MKDLNDISVIIPIFNEEASIEELYQRLRNTLQSISSNYEMIFVNDGSRDGSEKKIVQIAEADNKVFYINFNRNFGHQVAVCAGLEKTSAKCTVIIDGDLQDPPELISELYAKYKEGFDVVYAQRNKRKGESFFKRMSARLFYRVLEKMTSFTIPLDSGDFRLIDRKVVQALNEMSEQNKFLRGQIAWLGFSQTAVLFDRPGRKHGKTGYSYGKMFRLALDAITGFSDKPLLFVSRMGFIISFISFLVILFSLFSHFFLKRTVTGWTSLIITFSFLGGIQLLSIGIIGEYIARINTNSKNRVLYVIKDSNIDKQVD